MMHRLLLTSLVVSGLPMAASAQAQPVPPSDDEEIVIRKRIDIDGAEARTQAREVTHRAGSSSEPMARFQSPICPGTFGLLKANAQAVIERIYANAEAAGLDIALEENCKANVWTIIVDDPATEFEKLEKEDSFLIDKMSKAERNAVRGQTGPTRAWTLTSTRDDNGVPIPTGWEMQTRGLPGQPSWTPTTRMSRLHVPVRRDIDGAVVLVARSALADIDAFTLADYVTMRGLAQTREPDGPGEFDSILTVFGERRAERLTTFDRAFLKSLYLSGAHRPSGMAMASLTKLMEEELNAGLDDEGDD